MDGIQRTTSCHPRTARYERLQPTICWHPLGLWRKHIRVTMCAVQPGVQLRTRNTAIWRACAHRFGSSILQIDFRTNRHDTPHQVLFDSNRMKTMASEQTRYSTKGTLVRWETAVQYLNLTSSSLTSCAWSLLRSVR